MGDDEVTEVGYRIRGRVQGVGFRWWTWRTAEELGLSGAVRNLRDGSVEVHVRGPAERVERFRQRLEQGPPAARVESVQRERSGLPIPEGTFRIAR